MTRKPAPVADPIKTVGLAHSWDQYMTQVKAADAGSVVSRCSVKAGDRVLSHRGTVWTITESFPASKCADTWVLVFGPGDYDFSAAGYFYPMTLVAP